MLSIVILRAEFVCMCACVLVLLNLYQIFWEVNDFSELVTAGRRAVCVGTYGELVLTGAHVARTWCTPYRTNHFAVPHSCQCAGYNHGTCTQLTRGGKEQSAYCFSLPRGHHFKMMKSCCGCEFLSAPLRALSGGKSTDFLCLNGLAKDNFLYEKEGEENPLHIFVLDLYNHFKMAPVLLCFVHERWFESYVGLNETRQFWVCYSVWFWNQPLQCSCGLQQCFCCYSIF